MLSIKSILTTLALLITINISAQINGNKKSETRSFPLENVTSFNLELYANVTIDPTEANENGDWEIKVFFPEAPAEKVFVVKAKDNKGNKKLFEFIHYV